MSIASVLDAIGTVIKAIASIVPKRKPNPKFKPIKLAPKKPIASDMPKRKQ
jgi:hypothetical protein